MPKGIRKSSLTESEKRKQQFSKSQKKIRTDRKAKGYRFISVQVKPEVYDALKEISDVMDISIRESLGESILFYRSSLKDKK